MRYLVLFLGSLLFAKELIFYCGITMAKDMREIADEFEKKEKVKIEIIPGASKELLLTIKKSKSGDLYLPGAAKYVLKNKNLFINYKPVGYNQLVLVEYKDANYTLNDLFSIKAPFVLCNYETSSCGKITKKFITKKYGLKTFDKLFDNAVEIAMDSKPLNNLIANNHNFAGLNWKGSVKNKNLKTKDIGAKKTLLLLAVVKYSKNVKMAKKFVDYVYKNKLLKKKGFK
jgi:molybdate transport system substrate-binding protein